ncbi:MAG: DUF1934 domain-containing protein [Oscillibacter sp.]|nr:DUF1934 domain-containing protein [Oscillibacter sp.]
MPHGGLTLNNIETKSAAPAPRPEPKPFGHETALEAETAAVIENARSGPSLPVLLTIHSEQDIDSPQQDNMELLTEGVMDLKPGGLTLTYQESALTGMEGTTTIFEMRGPQVVLRRTGTVSSQMIFEEGRQHTSLYETPFGELSVDVQTGYLRNSVTERGGLLEIRYSVSVEHASAGKNRFRMNVRRKRGETTTPQKDLKA